MTIRSEGKGGIYAEVLADSIAVTSGVRLFSVEVEYPRFIHSEVMTHRVMSRNAASCLHGDTEIYFDLPKGLSGRNGKRYRRIYKITIANLYKKWLGSDRNTKYRFKYDYSDVIPEKIYTFNELADMFRCHESNLHEIYRKNDLSRFKENYVWKTLGSTLIDFANEKTHKKPHTTKVRDRVTNMRIRCLNEDTNLFDNTNITNVTYSGKKDVFLVHLEDGYSIKCSADHLLYSDSGWVSLNDMGLGKSESGIWFFNKETPKIATNGIEAWKDPEWLASERDAGKTIRQISEEVGVAYKSVAAVAEKNGIRFMKRVDTPNEDLSYKDKDWLLARKSEGLSNGRIAEICNTTEDRVKKSVRRHNLTGMGRGVILAGNKRMEPWNKGKTYSMTPEVYERHKERMKARSGPNSSSWKGGYENYAAPKLARASFTTKVKKEVLSWFNYKCAVTGRKDKLEIHHVDPCWHNPDRIFDKTNLIPLHASVHAYIHNNHLDLEFMEWVQSNKNPSEFMEQKFDKISYDDIMKPKPIGHKLKCKLMKIEKIDYIGLEDTYDIEVSGPYHNFVANGVVVHNSRAQPIDKVLERISENPAKPIHWGKNQAGMSARDQLLDTSQSEQAWMNAVDASIQSARALQKTGLHKQCVNRVVEFASHIKVILSATEWQNAFWLRCHPDAQPEIQELFRCIHECYEASKPQPLYPGEWHLPYIRTERYNGNGHMLYYDENDNDITAQVAKRISVSACAQVSYRKLDTSLEKADKIYDMLVSAKVKHSSPFEHQATPMSNDVWEGRVKASEIISDEIAQFSGNFRGWIQHRKEIPGENLTEDFKL